MNEQSTEDVQSCETTLDNTTMMDTYHQTLAQTHRYTRVNPDVSDELWMLMMVSIGSSIVKSVPVWQRMIMGEAMHVWRQEVYGKSLYLQLKIYVN